MELLIKNKYRGFTLVEAMLAIAILMVMGVGSIAANRLSTSSVTLNENRSKANNLSEEAMEALMAVRADNFLNIKAGTFHPVYSGTKWTLADGSETINGFTRKITIGTIQRDLVCFDSVCNITTGGGIDDSGTYKAEVSVSWNEGTLTKEIKLNSLITYWR